MTAPAWFWMVTTFLFGICIGSFLNVVIYRLPIGKSLLKPEFSFCPNCEHQLKAGDLVPLLSFLALGRKCRYCKQPISWRYFTVELLTGLLFVAVYLKFPQNAPNCVALLLFTSVLIPVYFIDFATFTIPLSLNLLAFAIAVGRDVWGIVQHEPGHALLWGWLPRSLFGAAVGMLIFGAVRIAGWLWKKREAMGLGDVLLARAMGAMLISVTPVGWNPLGLFPIWALLACFSGILVGIPLILWRNAHTPQVEMEEETVSAEEPETDGSSLKRELFDIAWCFCLGDAFEYLFPEAMKRFYKRLFPNSPEMWESEETLEADEPIDAGPPAPTAIPFGPFLVLGFLATVFFGAWITAAYCAWAFPKKPSAGT